MLTGPNRSYPAYAYIPHNRSGDVWVMDQRIGAAVNKWHLGIKQEPIYRGCCTSLWAPLMNCGTSPMSRRWVRSSLCVAAAHRYAERGPVSRGDRERDGREPFLGSWVQWTRCLVVRY